jgi:hypothetical protein
MADLRIQDFSFQTGGGKAFFILKLEGQPWTNWVSVTPAELASIGIILNSDRAVYDFDKGILKLLPAGGHGFKEKDETLPVLDFPNSNYPKKQS